MPGKANINESKKWVFEKAAQDALLEKIRIREESETIRIDKDQGLSWPERELTPPFYSCVIIHATLADF